MLVIMDEIANIHAEKDTTLALLLEAQKRAWQIYYACVQDLFVEAGKVFVKTNKVFLQNNPTDWISFEEENLVMVLSRFTMVFMRKDPPFDLNYLHTTYVLDLAQKNGAIVLNHPQSLRDANEKLLTTWFPHCCPPTLVTSQISLIQQFIAEHKEVIVKPLHNMGGQGVFLLKNNELNINATIELLTQKGQMMIMAQRFIPEIMKGDKRILMVAGKPYPYALARLPKPGDIRGNLAAGGQGMGHQLTSRDQWLCAQIGPTLLKKGLFFVGVDVIGDYITEINVTSPTCVKEIANAFQIDVAKDILDSLEEYLKNYKPQLTF